jgi:hypothetical protein
VLHRHLELDLRVDVIARRRLRGVGHLLGSALLCARPRVVACARVRRSVWCAAAARP